MNDLSLIGAYRVEVPEDELQFIAEEVCRSREEALEEVAGLTLLEIEVHDATPDFDIGLLHQEGLDQVPWDERYFSVDGTRRLDEQPRSGDFRVCFFLHRFDRALKICSPYGDLNASGLNEMPDRLRSICTYEHPG